MSMTEEKYDTTNQYCRKKTFPSSPLIFLFFFLISALLFDFFPLALINLPLSPYNDCHKTAYLSYLNYMKQLFSYLGSC